MFRMKRMTALLMSVLIMGSTVCAPAMAAEATGEETATVQEETAQQVEDAETGEKTDEQELPSTDKGEETENAAESVTTETAEPVEPENAAQNVTAEVSEPVEQAVEPENAAEDVTSEVAEPEEPAAAEVTEEKHQSEIVNKDNQESSGAGNTEIIAGTGATKPEDEYLPVAIVDGFAEDEGDGAYGAQAAWDAEKLASLPILDTDVSSASDGCIMLGLPGEYIADQQAVLDRINEIRREACEEGVINPETKRPLTMDDYVPLKWSHELEEIARIRAAESSMTGDHIRTNGGYPLGIKSTYYYFGECVAWNNGSSVITGVNQWYGEKQTWVDQGSGTTGHYTQLIEPSTRYVGIGTFWSPCTKYMNTTVAEFYDDRAGDGVDESFVGMTGECIQLLEVKEANLDGDPYITGTLSGVKDDEHQLFLTTNTAYNSRKLYSSEGILFVDGVNWSSNNSGIASVSSDGTVTAKKCGSATITAQAENGSSASAAFTVEHVLKKIPAVEETCTKSGLTEGEKCANCGKITIEQETIPAKGHAYGSWKVTKSATCTTNGSKEKVCANCGNKVTETINALGHRWNEDYTVDKEAKCKEDGSESIHCSVCNAVDTSTVRSIPAKGHAYSSWKVTKSATCTTAGSKEKVCANCGDKVTDTIKPTGHTWNKEYTIDKNPTILSEGSQSIHCSVCGVINPDSVQSIPKLEGSWKKDSFGWWYDYGDYTYPVSKFEEIDGKTYYFDEVGYRVTGWKKIDNYWYFFNNDGTMHIGWRQVGSIWYYFDGNGHLLTGWQKIHGYWYYFNGNGARQTGLQHLGNYWYYFNSDGKLHTGWRLLDGSWYYFNGNGARVSGWQKINGSWYYFSGDGVRQTGWQHLGSHWYYFNSDGKLHFGWRKSGSTWYYFDGNGAMVSGWQKINGYWYYFNGNGARQTGWQHLGSHWYYFNNDGKLHFGWRLLDGSWYYFDKNGAMVTGRQQINGTWYNFSSSGERL